MKRRINPGVGVVWDRTAWAPFQGDAAMHPGWPGHGPGTSNGDRVSQVRLIAGAGGVAA